MSGGVDSSVAAALLVEEGFDVRGVTFHLMPDGGLRFTLEPCCSIETAEDARRAAERLGIRHSVWNAVEPFEQSVIGDFVREYRSGRTPNPCIRCNRHIKFGLLSDLAREWGAQFIATGHYARVETREGRATLLRAMDRGKDQSYVLACLNQEQLRCTLFPLGNQTKGETRAKARALGLTSAERPESQEICFIPDNDYGRFIESRIGPTEPGPILSADGSVLGRHKGIAHYTVGQRKGLGLAAPRPYYVLAIDAARNAVVVGHDDETRASTLDANCVNYCSGVVPDEPFDASVQIRYRHTAAPARVIPDGDHAFVEFHVSQRAVTPGQWAVFYVGDEVVGGGIIDGSR